MTDRDKKIMQACGALVPHLTDLEKEKFLSFTEGMAFLSARQRQTCDAAPRQEAGR